MKILITGSEGFVAKNLTAELANRGYTDVFAVNRSTAKEHLSEYARRCEFVFHLAGVNRPQTEAEFMAGNFSFTAELLSILKKHQNQSPVLFASSTQAAVDNAYGRSKKAGEELLFEYGKETGAKVLVYRLPNLFGKWSKPNYNSVVATFCYNITRNLEIKINDPEAGLILCHIDDVISEFLQALAGHETKDGDVCRVPVTYQSKLGELANKLYAFHNNRETLVMPSLASAFDRALYGTYLSYLEEDDFSYRLKKNTDDRGWLAEFIKSQSMGQIFISSTKPGITRGNHWHHTKVEKFLVVQGKADITFRKIDTETVLKYKVSGATPEVVDIPAGYTHAITNTGQAELITLFWASEIFNHEKPDTYRLEV